jgi:hypothetical protein
MRIFDIWQWTVAEIYLVTFSIHKRRCISLGMKAFQTLAHRTASAGGMCILFPVRYKTAWTRLARASDSPKRCRLSWLNGISCTVNKFNKSRNTQIIPHYRSFLCSLFLSQSTKIVSDKVWLPFQTNPHHGARWQFVWEAQLSRKIPNFRLDDYRCVGILI